MNRRIYFILFLGLGLSAYFLFFQKNRIDMQEKQVKALSKKKNINGSLGKFKEVPSSRKPAATTNEKSLEQMTRVLASALKNKNTMGELIEEIKPQSPFVSRQSNPDTGDMYMIRTEKPLKGTRYFHAQYFSQENSSQQFMQHMSFEIQAGKNSLAHAIQAVKNNFTQLGLPIYRTQDYIGWKVSQRYILWIKQMAWEDMKDDPFNAYTSKDIGAIRVALELEVH